MLAEFFGWILGLIPDKIKSKLVSKEERKEKHLDDIKKEVLKPLFKLLDEFFSKYNNLFEWVKPKAGAITFPKIKFNKNIEELCR